MNPYYALLRTNRNYRLLFIGQTVSQLGDWFSAVAVYALLLDLTGSATAVAWMMIMQFLPFAIVGPAAGVVVDRVNRRTLMIAADVLRGIVVLGLLVIRRPDQVWIAYAVTAVMVSASAFFEPARTATIPNITSADELMPANALSSALGRGRVRCGAEDASAAGTAQRLVGRERHDVRVRHGVGVHAAGDETGDVRGVEHEQRTDLVGDLPERLGVDGAGVGGGARHDHLRAVLQRPGRGPDRSRCARRDGVTP